MLFQFYLFKRNKYGSKSERIYDKDHIHQSENISISQNFIICVFCNLHFLAKNMHQKYTKIEKLKKSKCLYINQKVVLDTFLP